LLRTLHVHTLGAKANSQRVGICCTVNLRPSMYVPYSADIPTMGEV